MRFICRATGIAVEASEERAATLLAAGFYAEDGAETATSGEPAEAVQADEEEAVQADEEEAVQADEEEAVQADEVTTCSAEDKPDTDSASVSELVDWCRAHGIQTKRGMKRADIVALIEEA